MVWKGQLNLAMSKSQLGSTGFETIKGSWRAAEAWHNVVGLESLKKRQEREVISKDAVGSPGLKGSQRKVEAWHHVAGSESLERAQQRLLVKV